MWGRDSPNGGPCNGGIPSAGRRRVRPRRSRSPFPWPRIRVSTRSRRNVLTFPQHFGKDRPTMQTIEMRALRAATVKPIGECGQPKLVSSGTREKRTMFAYVRLCSPMFAYVRLCSLMFAYVRLMGKKLLRARRAATWGREGRQKEECRMALRAATGGAAQGHDWGMQNARQMDDGRSRLRQIKAN